MNLKKANSAHPAGGLGANSVSQTEVQTLSKEVTVAREMAILGDYENSIIKFKQIFGTVHAYAKKYEVPSVTGSASKLGNYAAPTSSSSKKVQRGRTGPDDESPFADAYLHEMWTQMKNQLKVEYDQIVQMHQILQKLDDADPAAVFGNKNFYAVDCFEQKEKPSSSRGGRRAPVASSASALAGRKKSNMPPESSPGYSNQGSAVKQSSKSRFPGPSNNAGGIQNTPPVSRSQQPALKKGYSKIEQSQDQDAAAQGDNFVVAPRSRGQQKRPTNVAQSDVFNYKDSSEKKSRKAPNDQGLDGIDRMIDHFKMAPFQHHKMPAINLDDFAQAQPGESSKDQQDENYVEIFQKPQNMAQDQQDKDPDVWDPPTPPRSVPKKKQQWGAQKRPANRGRAAPAPSRPGARNAGGPSYNDVDDKRNYDKPWLAPEKKNKNSEPKTYHEHVYGDSMGPDSELINKIEKEMMLKNPNVNFDDIAGLDETKKLLQEAVLLPILMPDYFRGIRRPWKGVCMFGPPGTGKTMLAKAVASQGQTTFFNCSASTLASKWKGESEKLVRILFEVARFHAPSTIFFDEIDALASERGGNQEHEASRRVKAELLVQMDGANQASSAQADLNQEEEAAKKTCIVLAATNRPQDLDEAIRRRLEKRVYIPLPDKVSRESLFQINLKGIELASNIDFAKLTQLTDGYSGADMANICRDAAMEPLRRQLDSTGFNIEDLANPEHAKQPPLEMQDFMTAISKNQKTVSQAHLQEFKDWMAEFGSA